MIDGALETFIVQRQGDQLLVQRITIDHMTAHYRGAIGDGYYTAAATIEIVGTLAGGGLFDPGDAAAFVAAPREIEM